jgi:hypothetical protein
VVAAHADPGFGTHGRTSCSSRSSWLSIWVERHLPSVPQYHRQQTLGRESGDGRPERASTALELAESRATPSRVTIQAYRPTGHLRYGKAITDMKHVR